MSSPHRRIPLGARRLWRILARSFVGFAAVVGVAQAQTFYWAGSGGDPATAGGGRWDLNDSVVWRDADPAGLLVKWTDHRTVVFQGTAGGDVTIADSFNVSAIQFAEGAGAFTLASAGGIMNIAGAGISCDSPVEQRLTFHQAILNFSKEANAGNGTRASHIHLTSDALTTFTDTATAGRATITNGGELQFAGQSSAGDAAITNTSLVHFLGEARGGAAAVTNQGQLILQDHAHEFSATAISNTGLLDLAAVAAEDAINIGALMNGTGSVVLLGTKSLTLGQFQLVDENVLSFDLATEAVASITVTSSLLQIGAKKRTQIAISDTGGLVRGRRYRLLDWSAASWVSGVKLDRFALQPLPAGFSGKLTIDGKALWLEIAAPRR